MARANNKIRLKNSTNESLPKRKEGLGINVLALSILRNGKAALAVVPSNSFPELTK
jgi:hypothetical protein